MGWWCGDRADRDRHWGPDSPSLRGAQAREARHRRTRQVRPQHTLSIKHSARTLSTKHSARAHTHAHTHIRHAHTLTHRHNTHPVNSIRHTIHTHTYIHTHSLQGDRAGYRYGPHAPYRAVPQQPCRHRVCAGWQPDGRGGGMPRNTLRTNPCRRCIVVVVL